MELPLAVLLFWFFVLGTIIGSFLNVVIFRFNTGKSLRGRSHCLSCGVQLRWYELFPVVSYILQIGRCRNCSARLSPRYLVVELMTGVLYALTVFLVDDLVLIVLNLLLVTLLTVIVFYDIRHTIIPDVLVVYLSVVALAYILWDPLTESLAAPSVSAFLSGIGAAFFFAALWYVSKGRWIGLGDAKLALPLGVIAGVNGVFSLVVLSFWIGAVVSLCILGAQYLYGRFKYGAYAKQDVEKYPRYFTMKSEVPFAPFLVAAFFLVHFFSIDVFSMAQTALLPLFTL